VTLVVSRADARRGRRGPATPSPVKATALRAGIPVSDETAAASGAGAELGVVVAYGRLIPARVLEKLPMVNLHFSLLPRWRGAAPVEHAILEGDPVTGVSLMAVGEGLDEGPVYRRIETPIRDTETVDELSQRLAVVGSSMLVDALATGLGVPEPQHGPVSYAGKLTPEDRRLRWEAPAIEVSRVVRIGRAWTTFRDRRLLVLGAAPRGGSGLAPGELGEDNGVLVAGTGAGVLALEQVQPEGKGPLTAVDWWRGARPQPGERLGEAGPMKLPAGVAR
jgi:methionyl-tRNA formyltransferase